MTLGSARSRKNFLDKQSETCQKSSSSRKSTDLRRKVDFSNSTNLLWKWHDFIHLGVISTYFQTFIFFCIMTLGSARSQKNFLDKQSETCQKSSSSRKSTDLRRKVDFSNSTNLLWKWHDFIHLGIIPTYFQNFIFFCIMTWGSARSQKIFLDKQSETCQKSFSSKKSTDLRRKVDFSKSIDFPVNYHTLYTSMCNFPSFSDVCVCL